MRRAVIGLSLSVCLSGSAAVAAVAGWRSDWTGRYPDAAPVTEWSQDKNVVWKTKMPSWSNSTPVISGDRLFVCSEPGMLLCAKLSDGSVLWKAECSILDALPAEEAERARKLTEGIDVDALAKRKRNLQNQLRGLKRRLKRSPDDEKTKQRIASIEKELPGLKAKVDPIEKYALPSAHETNGYSSMTPVTDGRHVWTLFGSGVAACYDTSGKRRWIRMVQKPTQGYGQSASPLLADGKLIAQFIDMFCLDAATGREIWKCSRLQHSWGTGICTKIGGAGVVITPGGNIVRLSDGAAIGRNIARLHYNQPLLDGPKVFYIQDRSRCIKLPAAADDRVNPEKLWEARPKKDRYYASPVLHEGLIYAITQANHLSVIDAADGKIVYNMTVKELRGRRSTVYPSIVLAGGHIFISNDEGKTLIMKPGRTFEKVAENTLEKFRSTPVFKGSRMYVRGYKHLWCIGK